jgi:type VI secretion system protein ImpC
MPGRTSFEFELSRPRERKASRPRDDSPMRILVMGDFSARGSRGAENHADLASRSPIAVDIDDFERVMSRLAPRLELPLGTEGGTVTLEFSRLDDFHPDALYRRLELFQALRKTRERLQDAATFDEAAAEFRGEAQRRVEAPAADPSPGDEADKDTFSRLLGGTPKAQSAQTQPASSIDALIRGIVAPHIVPDAPPFQAQYVASVDAATGDEMRRVLHDGGFQALESLWRGVHRLVSNLELGEALKLYVLDVSKAEALADVRAVGGEIEKSALYRLLVEKESRTAGGEPWSVIAGDYAFGLDGADVGLLACLGAIASHAGGPFLAAAKPALAGFDSPASMPDARDWRSAGDEAFEAWRELRESVIAPCIGLALPRMLLRLPYGKATEPVEAFDFEELGAARDHERYLWGNGAYACTLLIGRAFLSRGWEMEPGDELDVEDLPAHTYSEDDEKRLQPCAETNTSDRAGQALLERGLIPLLSYKNRNAIRVMRLQSIADPPQPLSGPWT